MILPYIISKHDYHQATVAIEINSTKRLGSSRKHIISLASTLYGLHRAWLGVGLEVWVRG
jgi:hypothetical protein